MSLYEEGLDKELIEKLQKGDLGAYDKIFQKYSNKLFGFALKYLKSKEDSEGVIQDVFLKVWENRKKLKKESSLKSYLFTITYHNMCRVFRKRQIHLKFIDEALVNPETSIDPEENFQYKATLERLGKLIDKLPEKQKEIFKKSRNEGKSTREIAEEMNLSPGTVDNYISAAIKFLRNNITEEKFTMFLFLALFIQ